MAGKKSNLSVAKKSSQYNIDLKLTSDSANKAVLDELNKSFKGIDNQVKKTTEESLRDLNTSFDRLLQSTDDLNVLEKQYGKVVDDNVGKLKSEIDALEAKKVKIANNTDLTEKQRDAAIKILETSIKQKKQETELLKIEKAKAKARVLEKKYLGNKFNTESKLVKLHQKAVELQTKMNNLLQRESKLKTAALKAGKVAGKVGKAGLKAGGLALKGVGLAGAAIGAIGGAAIAAVGDQAAKEKALKSLKSGIDPTIADRVYVQTGADYNAIVSAINSLSKVTKDSGQLIQGAVLEIQNPGIGRMLLSTSMSGTGNLSNLKSHIDQIKKQTGSQDLTAALEASTKSRAVTHGRTSQTEYIQAYAALEAQGLDEETINRVINKVSSQKGDFIENLNKTDLSQYGKDAQERIRLGKANLGLEKLNNNEVEKSTAEKVQEQMRKLSLKKDELLVKILPLVNKLLDALKPELLDKLIDVVVKLGDALEPALENLLSLLEPLIDAVMPLIDGLIIPLLKWYNNVQKKLIENVLKPALEWLKNTGMPALVETFKAIPHLPQMLSDGIKWWWEKIKDFPGALWNTIVEGASSLGSFITESIIDPIGTKISDAWESLKSWVIEKWNTIKSFFSDIVGGIKDKIVGAVKDATVGKAVKLAKNITDNVTGALGNVANTFKTAQENVEKFYKDPGGSLKGALGLNAQGGIVNSPSLCGEAGPELVLPLDNSRSGRASQIINNFNTNQNFNMSQNQTTPLAFAQAVGMNKFVRRSVI